MVRHLVKIISIGQIHYKIITESVRKVFPVRFIIEQKAYSVAKKLGGHLSQTPLTPINPAQMTQCNQVTRLWMVLKEYKYILPN